MPSELRDYTSGTIETVIATILSGQTESNIVNVKATTLKTIILPAAFDGTSLLFKVSTDGVTFFDYYNANNLAVSVTCSANRAYGLAAIDFYSIKFLKLVSNAIESADRNIQLIVRRI